MASTTRGCSSFISNTWASLFSCNDQLQMSLWIVKSLGPGETCTDIREDSAESFGSAADNEFMYLQGLVRGVNGEVGEGACGVKPVSSQYSHPCSV